MSTENKEVVRRIFEDLFNRGDVEKADELVASDLVEHSAHPSGANGPGSITQIVAWCHRTLPDVRFTIEDMVAEGDYVAARVTLRGTHQGEMMGLAPTGKRLSQAQMHLCRIVSGKMVEHWEVTDGLALMQQLGVIPSHS